MDRRRFLTGLVATLAAPAVVKAEILMPVKRVYVPYRMPSIKFYNPGRYVIGFPTEGKTFDLSASPRVGDILTIMSAGQPVKFSGLAERTIKQIDQDVLHFLAMPHKDGGAKWISIDAASSQG